MFGQNRLGMKLNTRHGKLPVPDAHDFINSATFLLGPGRHFETFGQTGCFYYKRMVTGGGKRIVEPPENILAVVVNFRCLAVHDLPSLDDTTTINLTDTLVTQADTKDRNPALEILYHTHRYARFIGCTGAG